MSGERSETFRVSLRRIINAAEYYGDAAAQQMRELDPQSPDYHTYLAWLVDDARTAAHFGRIALDKLDPTPSNRAR